jgi:hypothetical protein
MAHPVRGSLAKAALAAARCAARFRTTAGTSMSIDVPFIRAVIHASTVSRT